MTTDVIIKNSGVISTIGKIALLFSEVVYP